MTDSNATIGNIWNLDEDEDLNEGEGEPGGEGEGGEKNQSSEDLDPKLKAKLEEMLAEREAALAKSIEDGDQNNGVYKGLQRSMAAKDRKIADLEAQVTKAAQVIEEFASRFNAAVDDQEGLKEILLSALDEDDRKVATGKLEERNLNRSRKQLEEAQQRAQQRTQTQASSSDEEQVQALIRERTAQFIAGRKASAKRFGVDPDDKRLDYGSDGEGLIERMEKFDASLAKAIDEDRANEEAVNRVRPKTNTPATRSSGGGNAPASSTGASRLERGADEALRKFLGNIR